MDYQGHRGVWVPEAGYRQYREDQRKGFGYYTNWTLAESQRRRSDSIAENNRLKAEEYKTGMEKAESVLKTCTDTQEEADLKIGELVAENGKLQWIKKAAPWLVGGSFVVGVGLGAYAISSLRQ